MMGGFWSAELKYAGYDQGDPQEQVPKWSTSGSRTTTSSCATPPPEGQGRAGGPGPDPRRAERARRPGRAIGLAGENRCFTASIEQSRSSSSRQGGGAIMGDKKIKAIAVRGTKDVQLARATSS